MRRALAESSSLALALASCSPRRARATPPVPSGEAKRIDGLLDAWRFREAEAALDALKKVAPDVARDRVPGRLRKFLRGDYDGAVPALTTAAQAMPQSMDAKILADLAREARDAVKDHKEERSAHVIIRYAPEDAVLVPYAREALEAAYKTLHDDLGFEPRCRSASSCIAARPIWPPCRRCRRRRSRAPARSRCASGRG